MTRITVETTDHAAADDLAERVGAQEVRETGDHFELRIELGAVFESHAEHGRALATLLDAIHSWLDTQEATEVDVTIDGRRLTLHATEPG